MDLELLEFKYLDKSFRHRTIQKSNLRWSQMKSVILLALF